MTQSQTNVKEFMVAAGQAVKDKPGTVDGMTAILRVRLLLEEVLEFAEASGVEILTEQGDILDVDSIKLEELTFSSVGAQNLTEIADAIADINYVSYGAALSYGIDMEPIEDEVHKNNMSKFIDGHRDENGKWIKGPSYTPANIEKLIKDQLK